MDETEDKHFTDWVIETCYAYTIWKIGGFPPGMATSKRLRRLERKGRKIVCRHGEGMRATLAHLDHNREAFEWFVYEGLHKKFYEYWGAVLLADEMKGAKHTIH